MKKLFAPMLERGATCTWETFTGEIHDSLNHAWSAILPYAVQKLFLAIQYDLTDHSIIHIQPQTHICNDCEITCCTASGNIHVSWHTTGPKEKQLSATVSNELSANIIIAGKSHHLQATGGALTQTVSK